MSNNDSLNFANKVLRKQKRCQHIIEKETGIITSFSPTKVKYFDARFDTFRPLGNRISIN